MNDQERRVEALEQQDAPVLGGHRPGLVSQGRAALPRRARQAGGSCSSTRTARTFDR